MGNRFRRIFLVWFAVLSLLVPALRATHATAESAPTLTVLCYIVGSSLESEAGDATKNLEQMLAVPPNKNVNLVLQTGGTSTWHNDFVRGDQTQRFFRNEKGFECVSSFDPVSSGDAQVLSDFIAWGVEHYPADRYMLLFWNHGGGAVEGFGSDELFGHDDLSMAEFQHAMQDARARTGITFAMVGFDACLMATLETALAFEGAAEYLVASAEFEPASGWDYEALLRAIYADPAISGEALGRVIADSYKAARVDQSQAECITLSVIDLTRIGEVRAALDTLAAEMDAWLAASPGNIYELSHHAGRALSYGGYTAEEGFSDMVDLKDLAHKLQTLFNMPARVLENAVREAVVYQVTGWARRQSGGLSIYWPLRDQEDFDRSLALYDTSTASPAYRQFVSHMAQAILDKNGETRDRAPFFTQGIWKDDLGWCHAQLDPAQMNRIENVYLTLGTPMDEHRMVLLGEDQNLTVNRETGEIIEGFDCYWFAIDGHFVMPKVIEVAPDHVTYAIPVLLDGQQVSIRASFTWQDDNGGEYILHGAWPGIDSSTHMSARERIPLTPGQTLTPLYYLLDDRTGEMRLIEGIPFELTEAKMADQELVPGIYALRFSASDALFQSEHTDFLLWQFGE